MSQHERLYYGGQSIRKVENHCLESPLAFVFNHFISIPVSLISQMLSLPTPVCLWQGWSGVYVSNLESHGCFYHLLRSFVECLLSPNCLLVSISSPILKCVAILTLVEVVTQWHLFFCHALLPIIVLEDTTVFAPLRS